MYMHAMNMWLTDGSGGGFDFAPMARRDTTQVMLGVSQRARCDPTLVSIMPQQLCNLLIF